MYCTNCGAEKNKKVCSSCGQKKVKEIKFCKWCGSEIQQGYAVCTDCKEPVKPKELPALIGNIALIILFVIMLFISFDAVGLMSLFSVVGIVLSLPAIRNIVIKKTHDKIEKRKTAHILRYAVIFVVFVACLLTINLTDYNAAINNFENDPLLSLETMESFGDYKDAPEKVKEFKNEILKDAEAFIAKGDLKTAERYLDAVGDFDGVEEVRRELDYQKAVDFDKNYKYGDAKKLFVGVGDYKDAKKYLSKIEYGLIGNEYKYSAKTYVYGKTRLVYMSKGFSEVTSKVHIYQAFNPKVYYNSDGDNLDVSEHYQFKFEGNQMYIYSDDLKAPEDTKDWIEGDTFKDIVRDGNTITSFNADGIVFKIETE